MCVCVCVCVCVSTYASIHVIACHLIPINWSIIPICEIGLIEIEAIVGSGSSDADLTATSHNK